MRKDVATAESYRLPKVIFKANLWLSFYSEYSADVLACCNCYALALCVGIEEKSGGIESGFLKSYE